MHMCKTIDIDVKYLLLFIAHKIFYVYFAIDVEDSFGYGKVNFLSYKCLTLNINSVRTTTAISDIKNIEYFTDGK